MLALILAYLLIVFAAAGVLAVDLCRYVLRRRLLEPSPMILAGLFTIAFLGIAKGIVRTAVILGKALS